MNDGMQTLVARALEAMVDEEALPKTRFTVMDCAILALYASFAQYREGGTQLAAELDALLECFFNDDDPLIQTLDVETRVAVRSSLNVLRRARKGRLTNGSSVPQEATRGGSASGSTPGSAAPP